MGTEQHEKLLCKGKSAYNYIDTIFQLPRQYNAWVWVGCLGQDWLNDSVLSVIALLLVSRGKR